MTDSETILLAVRRRMTGRQRIQIAAEMSDVVRDLALAGIRARHPEWSNEQRLRELVRYAFLTQTGHEPPYKGR